MSGREDFGDALPVRQEQLRYLPSHLVLEATVRRSFVKAICFVAGRLGKMTQK